MSEFYEFYEERKRKHYHQRHELEREGDYVRDPSCTECYLITFEPEMYFHNFWEWYRNVTPAETYNLYTVRQLEELITDTIGIIEQNYFKKRRDINGKRDKKKVLRS